ncbi:unnamed protein product [Lymnaea stagnalis]|uniref:Ribosome-binding protein 1 n=1 Tax=Lymnaea stagnalis TaxID=6523 RepID=A0AAV2HS56_LYMST
MEVVTILIGVAAFIISALLIYCISAVSMREKTFEEVMEEQRRRQEEEREKVKAEKKAEKEQQKKKYKKGKQDKVKEKSAQVNEPELKIETKMVNLEIEPEIIEPTETLGLNTAVRQRGKKEKVAKPILHNKGEVTPVSEKTVEIHHKPIIPKDELELKKSHEKIIVDKIEKLKSTHIEAQVKETIRQEIKENVPPKKPEKDEDHKSKQNTDEAEKRSAKSKTSDDGQLNGSKLISSVKTAKLSDNEVQTLIDILLNRQGLTPTTPAVNESWNKDKKSQKGDPVYLLKKQLEDKEKALQEEQNQSLNANSRVKELKNELMSEKSKLAILEKKLQEKGNQHKTELDALHQRMQHSHEQHLSETNNLQVKIRQLETGADKAAANKLVEENKILQETLSLKAKETVSLGEKVKQLEKELNNGRNAFQASEAAKKSLETKLNISEEKFRKLEASQKDVDSVINKRVEDVSLELRKAEAKNTSLASDLQKANAALSTAQGECSNLKTKLQELENHLKKADASKETETRLQESEHKRSDLEGNIKNLEKQLDDLSKRLDESKTEVTRLQQENKGLVDENRTINERLQTAPASNGIHENGPNVSSSELDRVLAEKSKEISDLMAGLENQKKAVSNFQTQLDNKSAEIADLTEQLKQQKTKNNELREKNWKAMEALEKSEKSSAEKVDKALKSAREFSTAGILESETYDKAVFQRLFPDIQISEKLAHREWVVSFEKQAVKKLQNASLHLSLKTSSVEKENELLKTEIDVLKKSVSSLNSSEDKLKVLEDKHTKALKQIQDYERQVAELNSNSQTLNDLKGELAQLKSSQSLLSTEELAKIAELENGNSRLKTEVDHYRSIVSETENKLHQLEKSIDAEEKKWQEKLKQAQSSSQKDSVSQQKVLELGALVAQQELQIEEYRKILTVTANSLTELEKKVATEEKLWQDKLTAAQSELTKVHENGSFLAPDFKVLHQYLDLSDLCFAYHCVEKSLTSIVDEMQERVEKLETELREAQERIVVITREKETVISQITETSKQVSSSNSEVLEQQLTELQNQLDVERKKSKELSLNVVKLNGIIKTGQDALAQEQGLVKKLKESLDSKSVHSGLTEAEETEQLRVKLSEKQKLLEREMATNKQLSEKLAATTNPDNGTSV